jgi:hypothetical protein
MHVPVASQVSSVHSLPSFEHALPTGTHRQLAAEQQSAALPAEGSQLSSGSIAPFPHLVAEKVMLLQMLALDVHVMCVSSPSPVPLQNRSSQSPGIAPALEYAPVAGSTVPLAETW